MKYSAGIGDMRADDESRQQLPLSSPLSPGIILAKVQSSVFVRPVRPNITKCESLKICRSTNLN